VEAGSEEEAEAIALAEDYTDYGWDYLETDWNSMDVEWVECKDPGEPEEK
jgi:hypothetical protein